MTKNVQRRRMNLNALLKLLVFTSMLWSGQLDAQTIRISQERTTLARVVAILQEKFPQTNFAFNPDAFEKVKLVRVDLEAPDLTALLEVLKKKLGLHALVDGNNVTLKYIPIAAPKSPGRVYGKVTDEETGMPVAGASIKIGSKGITTDENGAFTVSLMKGRYDAEVSSVGYGTKKIIDVGIKDDEVVELNITLKRVKGQLTTVTVKANRIQETGTNTAMINEIRQAEAVVNGISREQVNRSQDRDAAEVVRRVPGVSVMQNRFIVIRGMGQRYNAVMLNNAIAPSFEPDSRAFSFDIIPSGMIDRIMVYKTAVPELPGDFAGGVVKVYTTGVPARNNFSINYSTSYRPNSTFRDFYGQKDGKNAWLGYDDGTYKKPIDYVLLQNSDYDFRMDATRRFNKNWEPENKGKALPDQRFSIDYARRLALSSTARLGITTGLGYTQTRQYQVQYRNPRDPGGAIRYTASDELYDREARVNGVLNLSLELGKDHQLSFKNLYTHLGTTRSMYRRGYSPYDVMNEVGIFPGDNFEQFLLMNDYKGIYTGQLNGSHVLWNGQTKIDWIAGYMRSDFDAPDERRRTHSAASGTTEWGPWVLGASVGLGVQGRHQRIFMHGAERVKTLALNMEQKLAMGNFKPFLKAGIYWEDKTKTSSYVGFAHIDSALVGGAEGGFNQYDAYNILKAGYLSTEIPFLKKFKLYAGLRIENNLQHLGTTSRDVTGPNTGPILLHLENTSLLPSANLSYSFTAKTQIRAAYYRTLNRPEFREISAVQYYDMANNSYVYGNPGLLTQADIDNFDLRLEHYPGAGEMISFALFHKKILNPYELYSMASTGGIAYIWRNSEKARNYGAEIEVMLGLGRYFNGHTWISRQAQQLSVLFNAAYVYSRLELGKEQIYEQGVDHRPLMGQSPYLINTGLNYTNDSSGLKINLSYNIIGKRIAFIGNRQLAAVWELPRHSMDLTLSKSFGRSLELKAGIQNLLNSRVVFGQDMDQNGKFDIVNNDHELMAHKEHDNRYLSFYQRAYFTLGIGLKL